MGNVGRITLYYKKKKLTARKSVRWIVIAGGSYNNPTSADFQDQFVRVSFPPLKFMILATFVSFSHLWWFQWKFLKLTRAIDTTERDFWNFFQNFWFTPFSRNEIFLENRDFDPVQIMKHAILGLLGHEIERLIARSIGLSERNTWNFFQNFSFIPFSRNDV